MLLEGKGQHPDFHVSAGKTGGVFGGEKACIGAGDIDVTVEVCPEGVDGVFPPCEALRFVKEKVHAPPRENTLFHEIAEGGGVHEIVLHGLEVQGENLFFGHSRGCKVFSHEV